MVLTKTEYRDYIFSKVDDRERQAVQHRVFRPNFIELLNRLLDKFNLADRIDALNKSGRKFKILDFGCGEGLFLHDVAEILEARNLQDKVEFFGIDVDESAIATAVEYSKISQPPRPYLHYYVHDARNPLSMAWELFLDRRHQFDFIFSIQVLEHIPEAQTRLTELYNHLAPAGILYLRDFILDNSPQGWQMPHPAMNIFAQGYSAVLATLNNGVQVATASPTWLKELGAQILETNLIQFPTGGITRTGRDNLRNLIMVATNSGPTLVAKGALTQVEFDRLMDTLFRELTPDCLGQLSYYDTLISRPA